MKYKPYSRRELNKAFRAWAKEESRIIAVVALGMLVIAAIATAVLLVVWPATQQRAYALGAMHAASVAAFVQLVVLTFLAREPKAMTHVRGAWGEENTQDQLKRARRKGLVWGWVDSVTLASGDIDHVVVTRKGGVVVVDSKWRNSGDVADRDQMIRAAQKAKRRADGLIHSLLGSERGRRRERGTAVSVTPVVVVWGSFQRQFHDQPVVVDGIPFVPGRQFVAWLEELDGEPVQAHAANEILSAIEQFRAGVAERAGRP